MKVMLWRSSVFYWDVSYPKRKGCCDSICWRCSVSLACYLATCKLTELLHCDLHMHTATTSDSNYCPSKYGSHSSLFDVTWSAAITTLQLTRHKMVRKFHQLRLRQFTQHVTCDPYRQFPWYLPLLVSCICSCFTADLLLYTVSYWPPLSSLKPTVSVSVELPVALLNMSTVTISLSIYMYSDCEVCIFTFQRSSVFG